MVFNVFGRFFVFGFGGVKFVVDFEVILFGFLGFGDVGVICKVVVFEFFVGSLCKNNWLDIGLWGSKW